jgi:hypothetical protein
MTTTTEQDALLEKNLRRARKFVPLYLGVPIAYWLVFAFAGYPLDLKAFGLGVLGWIVALFLRAPISAAVMKLPKKTGGIMIASSSGPLEEGVRFALLAVTTSAFGWSLSLGQGWAAIEVVFTIINVIAIANLSTKTDEKSMQAKEMLKASGNINASPLWGVVERLSASALHIGATLLIAKHPWMVAVMIPVHTLTNLGIVSLGKKSIAVSELVMGVIGFAILIAGLLVFKL